MKTIVLIPVKNEDWILEYSLENIAPYVDLIIVADQHSTDRSVEICNRFSNVKVIENPYEGHSNKVRWLLLEEARKIEKESLIICIDADEMISPEAINQMKKFVLEGNAKKGDVFRSKWIQLWKNVHEYRDDGVWKDNFKNIAFVDAEGINEYKKDFVINDHTSRIPDTNIGKVISLEYPLLHFHFVVWKRNQLKQAWYRCSELIEGSRNAKMINNTYRVTLMPKDLRVFPIKEEWTTGLRLPENLEHVTSSWHLESIMEFFDKYGIEFFEQLQIWHVQELRAEFVKRTGREPISKVYPAWIVILNDTVNRIKNSFN